uniref:Potassium transporter 11-like isoform X2 n=1 Tax=Rhizophora mucronata TaxID=61149 RepID=A0A2P2PYN6_RHIMU
MHICNQQLFFYRILNPFLLSRSYSPLCAPPQHPYNYSKTLPHQPPSGCSLGQMTEKLNLHAMEI